MDLVPQNRAALDAVCGALADIALSCYGPNGRLKALQASANTPSSIITTSSGQLFSGMHIANPFGQLLVASTAMAQHAQYGDGGLACLYLAARMVQAGLQVATCRRDIFEACAALQAIGDRLQAVLTGAVAPGGGPIAPGSCSPVHVPCCGVQQYMAVCRGVLQPKLANQLTKEELEQLVALVVEAFVQSLPDSPPEAAAAGSITQRVTAQVMRGAPLSASCVVPGVAVEVDPESMPYGLQHVGCEEPVEVSVLLVCAALDGGAVDPALDGQAAGGSPDGPFRIVVEEAPGAVDAGEAAALSSVLRVLECILQQRPDTRFVLCQKGVHSVVQEWLNARGIQVVQRLGAARTAMLAAATGSSPLSNLLSVPTELECCAKVVTFTKAVARRQVLVFQPRPGAGAEPWATLLLACPSDGASADNTVAAINSALLLLRSGVLHAPLATHGAGAIELLLARDLGGMPHRCSGFQVRCVGGACPWRCTPWYAL